MLRRRLETAGVPVMIEWSGTAERRDAASSLVPEDQGEFAAAVVNEIDVDDEVADDSPHAYVARIEEHLSAAAGLLDELRTQLDELEADGTAVANAKGGASLRRLGLSSPRGMAPREPPEVAMYDFAIVASRRSSTLKLVDFVTDAIRSCAMRTLHGRDRPR